MANKLSQFGFTPQEHRISVLPSTIAAIIVLISTIFISGIFQPSDPSKTILFGVIGILGVIYLATFSFLIIPSRDFRSSYPWINAGVWIVGLGAITYALSEQLDIYIGVLLTLAVITSSIISDRWPSYFMIVGCTAVALIIRYEHNNFQEWAFHLGIALIAAILVETIGQLKNLPRNHIRRLETITEFSRQITSTLDTKQVMSLLNAVFQNAVEADTYFVGLREGSEMSLELIYDDGEYYENQRVGLDGSLSSWVLDHNQSLFLPDLRKEVDLPGVRLVLVGKHKTSLSWMGVPMKSAHVDGIIAIGSYRPNAFDRADLEVLTNLSQHAAQALDNTYRHAQVELQTRLDSLTGVYNHGYFLKQLQEQVDQSIFDGQPLSVIMLDIDHFKQYNDTYGHLAGDEILTNLCNTIKRYIKNTDAVGRWGGEEFVISLRNANAPQAMMIAERIREALSTAVIHNRDQKTIPVPTVSQGIAVFPADANETIKLIDIADHRLYVAKERGRNQIEPDPSSQSKLQLEDKEKGPSK